MADDSSSSRAPSREGPTTDWGGGELRPGTVGGRTVVALDSDIRLTLPARPENVAVVRHVLTALTEAVGLPASVVDDMRLAVTEAGANVVRHAYGNAGGSIDVVARASPALGLA